MEECKFMISYDDFVWIWMGAGVGYFLIGYCIASCINQHCGRGQRNDVLIAREVE